MTDFQTAADDYNWEHRERKAEPRPLHVIADEIRRDGKNWGAYGFAMAPYVDAMSRLSTMDDRYGAENARGIVAYFLSNARYWRGPVAKRIKAELKALEADGKRRGVRW